MKQPEIRFRRLGRDVDIISGFAFKSARFGTSGLPLVRIRDLESARDTETFYSGPYDERYIVNRGDILIAMDGDFRITTWRGSKALLNQRVCKLVPRWEAGIDHRFLFHALQRPLEAEQRKTSGTTVLHLSARRIRTLGIPDLARHNQVFVASMLDAIDEAIEHTEALIAATERLRDALLHELLTRGVPGWHSEWEDVPGIGTVPVGWKLVRLRDSSRLGSGEQPRYAPDDDGDVDVIGANGRIGSTDQANATRGVAVGRVGASGSVRRIREPVWLSDNVLLVEPSSDVWDDAFLYRALKSARLPSLASQTAQPLLTQTALGGVRVPLPSLEEQKAISAALDNVDEAMDRRSVERRKLGRLKAAIVDALMTGRIRLPGISEART